MTPRTAPAAPPPGAFVSVTGRSVHVLTHLEPGGSTPKVVFESALGCPCTEWIVLQRILAGNGISSLAYDRPGVGWSPPAKHPLDSEAHAALLNELIGSITTAPVVLVAHSVGGLLALSFAGRFPQQIAGVVFIDCTHPEQHLRSSRQREALRNLRHQLRRAHRHPRPDIAGTDVEMLPSPYDELTYRMATSPRGMRAALAEVDQSTRAWAPDAGNHRLDGTPLTVLTAGSVADEDPSHRVLQRELAALSAIGRHRIVPEATHQGIVMNPVHAGNTAGAVLSMVPQQKESS
ncbi:alpha/beta fold hydrolase [Auritidibacter ignavus]|uniref:alpha/beta fold hydrolase n=1 Tax=Auritidibacter ignavus TaxID=678932 RepID=UPI0024469F88|nr:alpha/beta hydrolase [Auritidibacter ignavus]WGH83615.1 alpha/beta hydrolase [Auritidibacter ignavus]